MRALHLSLLLCTVACAWASAKYEVQEGPLCRGSLFQLPAAELVALVSNVEALTSHVIVDVHEIPGGLSNRNFRLSTASVHSVNRTVEHACAKAAFAAGVSPEVVHYDPTQGTMLTRYVPNSRTLTNEDLHNPVMLQEIAHLLSRFHHGVAVETNQWYSPMIRVERYLEQLQDLQREHSSLKVPNSLPAIVERARAVDAALAEVLQTPTATKSALHCDLVPANFLHDGDRVWLVDFEYCHAGHVEFDLANIALMNVMDEDESLALAVAYDANLVAESSSRRSGAGHLGVTFLARQQLIKTLFVLCEGLWALVQEVLSDIPFAAEWSGFDSFEEYGLAYLQEADNVFAPGGPVDDWLITISKPTKEEL